MYNNNEVETSQQTWLAQLVERQTFNLVVKGSSPLLGEFLFFMNLKNKILFRLLKLIMRVKL